MKAQRSQWWRDVLRVYFEEFQVFLLGGLILAWLLPALLVKPNMATSYPTFMELLTAPYYILVMWELPVILLAPLDTAVRLVGPYPRRRPQDWTTESIRPGNQSSQNG